MTNSKVFSYFTMGLNKVEVLNNPEKYFGPNADQLIVFWNRLDTLTEEQLETIDGRYWDFYNNQFSEWRKAVNEAIEASKETIGTEFANKSAWAANFYSIAAFYATREIIGGIKTPVFLKMFDDV